MCRTRAGAAAGGSFTPFRDEGADGFDSVDWMAAQVVRRPRRAVGFVHGATSWLGAKGAPEALAGIAPLLRTNDCYDGWIYRKGVFELGFNLLLGAPVHRAVRSPQASPAPSGSSG